MLFEYTGYGINFKMAMGTQPDDHRSSVSRALRDGAYTCWPCADGEKFIDGAIKLWNGLGIAFADGLHKLIAIGIRATKF